MEPLVISYNKNGNSNGQTASERRPLMLLKDYLLDDMSSCSSNGFKSFPRRGRCCSPTVRFLLDADLNRYSSSSSKKWRRNGARRSNSNGNNKKGAIRKVSEAVLNAVKLLPFPSSGAVKSTPLSKLPRSFSRKLFKRGYFWRKASEKEEGIRRWTYFHVVPDHAPPDNPKSTAAAAGFTVSTSSSSPASNGNWDGTSWEFTTNSSESSGNDGVSVEKRWSAGREEVNGAVLEVGSSVGGTEEGSTKEWPIEDKEQFSPVSVLDCPFEDEEITSPFTGSLVHFEGTKKKHLGKLRRFENPSKLEPVDLQKRFAFAESDCGVLQSPNETQTSNSISSQLNQTDNLQPTDHEEENASENKAEELLRLAKATVSPIRTTSKVDNLLLDFFREQIERDNSGQGMSQGGQEYKKELALVSDWLNGKPQEVILGWEVEEGRQAYLRDMERHWVWKTLEEEKAEVALECESEAFHLLLEEVLIDFFSLP